MKQRKEFQKSEIPKKQQERPERPIAEVVAQINQIVDKNPKKAALILESWLKNAAGNTKKAS